MVGSQRRLSEGRQRLPALRTAIARLDAMVLAGQNERNALLVRISRQMANLRETKGEYSPRIYPFIWLAIWIFLPA